MRGRHVALAVTAAVVITLTQVLPSVALQATKGRAHYADRDHLTYNFVNADTEPWLENAFNLAAETWWHDGNNSRAPDWTNNQSIADNYVDFTLRTSAGNDTECPPDAFWVACSYYDPLTQFADNPPRFGREFGTMIYASNGDVLWCQDTLTNGCTDVGRIALHELGHMAGLSRFITDGNPHSSTAETYTVMRANTPTRPNTGWNRDHLLNCDLIELQRRYDLADQFGAYANCVDELGGGIDNGKLDIAIVQNAPSPSSTCTGYPVALSGTAKISGNTNLDRIAGNPLAGRQLTIRRNGLDYTTATVGGGGDWALNVVTSTPGTYTFQARFSGETAVDAGSSNTTSVTWSNGC